MGAQHRINTSETRSNVLNTWVSLRFEVEGFVPVPCWTLDLQRKPKSFEESLFCYASNVVFCTNKKINFAVLAITDS